MENRSLMTKIALLWLAIMLMGSFWLTTRTSLDPVSLVVLPKAPKEGEPVVATIKLNNPSAQVTSVNYKLYVNGTLLKEGFSSLPPRTSKVYQYACENQLSRGKQMSFLVQTNSQLGNHEQTVSVPSYPPQILSSFVSFASFSTSLMTSLTSMTYYQTAFGANVGLNLGLLFTLILVSLLVFLEITQPLLLQRNIAVLGRLQIRFSSITWILFIIFISIF